MQTKLAMLEYLKLPSFHNAFLYDPTQKIYSHISHYLQQPTLSCKYCSFQKNLPINGLWFNNIKFDMKKIVGGDSTCTYM